MRYLYRVCLLTFFFAAAVKSAYSAPAGSDFYTLKRRSSCSLKPEERPPFWPIGWVKRDAVSEVKPVVVRKPTFEEKDFLVTSILVGPPSLAVINGRVYMEGEFVRIPKLKNIGGVQVLVRQIHDGIVQLQAGDQLLALKLRRPDIVTPKKVDEDLLDDSR